MSALANGSWLTRDRIRRVAIISAFSSIALVTWLITTSHGTLDWRGRPLGTDFSDVWTAGRLALLGRAEDCWNWRVHFALQHHVHGAGLTEVYAWHYPPPFLLIATVLARLPYIGALIVWEATTLAVFVCAMQKIVPGRDALLLTLAAPVTLFCVTHGQNGFLTAALLAGGLLLLDSRPFLSGILLGCLIYKPHFAVLLPIPVALGRRWRTLAGALASSSLLVVATLSLWGPSVWLAFIESLPTTRALIIEGGAAGFYKNISGFAAARMWGAGLPIAYAVQAFFSATAIAAVILACRGGDRPELRNSIICAAALIVTPYALDYDAVLLLPALAWLYVDVSRFGARSWDATLMAFAWAAPLFARAAAQYAFVPLCLMAAVCTLALGLRRFVTPERGCDKSHSPALKGAGTEATRRC